MVLYCVGLAVGSSSFSYFMLPRVDAPVVPRVFDKYDVSATLDVIMAI